MIKMILPKESLISEAQQDHHPHVFALENSKFY